MSSISIGDIVIKGIDLIILLFAILFTFLAGILLINIDFLIDWLSEDFFRLIKAIRLVFLVISAGLAALFWYIFYVRNL